MFVTLWNKKNVPWTQSHFYWILEINILVFSVCIAVPKQCFIYFFNNIENFSVIFIFVLLQCLNHCSDNSKMLHQFQSYQIYASKVCWLNSSDIYFNVLKRCIAALHGGGGGRPFVLKQLSYHISILSICFRSGDF